MSAGLAGWVRGVNWRAVLVALLIGTAGGAAFDHFHLPLAWLLGAMVAVTAAAVAGVRVQIPGPFTTSGYAVLGVVMGSAFSPEIFDRLSAFAVTMSGLLLYVALIAATMLVIFRRVLGFDPRTAYFAAMPGGVAEMTAIGTSLGGDGRIIALFHATRILLVAFAIPMGFRFIAGYQPQGLSAMGGALDSIRPVDYLIFLGCALIGHFGGKLIRLPAPMLLGGLIVSALAHLTGLTSAKVPFLILALAQVTVGCAIGTRFAGAAPSMVLRMLGISSVMIALMLTITIGFTLLVGQFTDWPADALILAYAPGGLPEMTLVALVMGIDVVFVAAHHTVRIVFVVAMSLPCLRLMERAASRRQPAEPGP